MPEVSICRSALAFAVDLQYLAYLPGVDDRISDFDPLSAVRLIETNTITGAEQLRIEVNHSLVTTVGWRQLL